MLGKIRKKLIQNQSPLPFKDAELFCPICDRKIPQSEKDAHHLIPKSKGGKATQFLHRICHRQIHALFSETELAAEFNTAESLREHPEMMKFIQWVKNKPNGFYERVRKSERLKASRKIR